MKLLRFGTPGKERPGLEVDGLRYDASHLVDDYTEDFFARDGISMLRAAFDPEAANPVDPDIRLGVPVCKPGKIICIGLNYHKHAEESGMSAPAEPVVFFKATSSLTGPSDPIIIPRNSQVQRIFAVLKWISARLTHKFVFNNPVGISTGFKSSFYIFNLSIIDGLKEITSK